MAYFRTEPPTDHGATPRTGLLLLNLGTPDAPTPRALRSYLGQFLSDRRIVELPRALWWPILHGIVLNLRPRKVARKYARVWMPEGAPLRVHTQRQAHRLEGWLRERMMRPLSVEYGMRYGEPSIASALEKLKIRHCDRILLLPLYPQYAASSTASALDAVWDFLRHTRNVPEIRTVRHYYDDPGYIAALASSVRGHWLEHGRPEKLLVSFHGIPRRAADLGDPYACHCYGTTRRLIEALHLAEDEYQVCFQSRFGRTAWLEPAFDATLKTLARQGVRRVDVLCPGFSADCLETLEEVALEGKATFLNAGGEAYHYIPALNDREDWIEALGEICLRHLEPWDTSASSFPGDTP